MMELPFWLRLLNIALSVFVISLCFLKLIWDNKDRERRLRILAIALLSIAAAWMSYDLRYEAFHPRVPITMLGLASAAYCLHVMPHNEDTTKSPPK